MQQVWLFEAMAITVERIDFLDPALMDRSGARERGVRVEIRPVRSTHDGSIYASPAQSYLPAVCRLDFLESKPHAADRMHWHPAMLDGEPGDRTMEAEMGADPVGWLTGQLTGFDLFLARAGIPPTYAMTEDVGAVRAAADQIGACVDEGLSWAREDPWPPATHDERGLADLRGTPRSPAT